MATGKSGSFTIAGTKSMSAKCYWSETYDVASNTHAISIDKICLISTNWYGFTYYLDGTVSVENVTLVSFSSSAGGHSCIVDSQYDEYPVKAASGFSAPPWYSGEITGNADGSCSVTITLNFRGLTINGDGANGFSVSGSSTVALTTIPRASAISSAGNVTLGNKCSVKWTPASMSFRYKLKFSLGNWSYTTEAINPGTTSAYTYTGYTIPLDVAGYISSTSKTGTMTVALYTYSDAACSIMVGSVSTKTLTVTIPENASTKPSVSLTGAPASSLSSPFSDIFIQGMSKFQATITSSGKYGAAIASQKLTIEGKSYGAPYISGFIASSGDVTVKASVTDSRGFTGEVQKTITVIPYQKPKLLPGAGESGIICARCDASGSLTESGTYLKIVAGRSYSKVTVDDAQNNFCEIRYRYRLESANTFSDWITLLGKSDISADTVNSGAIANVVASAQSAYVVQLGVADDVGETDAIQFIIPTDFVTVDCPDAYAGRRMGLFRYVDGTEEDGVYVGLPIFGGSVDSLLTGSKLTATADAPISLDEVKTPGCYYCPDSENAQYVTDCPYTDGGFRLEVREIFSKDTIRQQIDYGSTILTRNYNGKEWSPWLPDGYADAANLLYPIGCYYWSSEPTNPATVLGFGVWERVKDKFILAAGDTYAAGATGGSAQIVQTINQMPKHTHRIKYTGGNANGIYGGQPGTSVNNDFAYNSIIIDYEGGGEPMDIMPPYIAAYCWHRTA